MNSYQSLSAQVYNFDKPAGKSFGDIEYYLDRLQGACTILEPAVGTGRVLIPLLQAGLAVKGFDLSENMLDFCVHNLRSLDLPTDIIQKASFTDFSFDQTFDAIIIPSGTFLLMTDDIDIKTALQKFHQHLNPQGKLIFDLFFQNDFQIGRTKIRTFERSSTDKITLSMTESEIDYANQVATYVHRYEAWENNALKTTELEIFKLKWLGIQEIALLLKQAGFTDITCSADYKYLSPVTNSTEVFTIEAVKP